MTRKLAKLLVAEKNYEISGADALRLQAKAWRLLAIIATHDQKYAVQQARCLLFETLPFVNGESVSKFIADHQQMAEDYGRLSGVFDVQSPV